MANPDQGKPDVVVMIDIHGSIENSHMQQAMNEVEMYRMNQGTENAMTIVHVQNVSMSSPNGIKPK